MIDVMTFFVKLMLVSVVLISIMNVMIMAVYERVREIGTMAAIGTLPRRILSLHVAEGFLLGVMGAAGGALAGTAIVWALGAWKISFAFGRQQGLLLAPTLAIGELATVSALVIVVSVLAGLQPAWKASRMTPVEALRHV
jgi:putative ABC transport system permease protein